MLQIQIVSLRQSWTLLECQMLHNGFEELQGGKVLLFALVENGKHLANHYIDLLLLSRHADQ